MGRCRHLPGWALVAGLLLTAPAHAAPPACTATGDALTLRAGETRNLSISCPGPAGESHIHVIDTPFAHATMREVSVSPPATVTYAVTADAAYTGADQITLRSSDGTSFGPSQTVSIEIRPATANTAPDCVARDVAPFVVEAGQTIFFAYICTDADNDPPVLSGTVDAGTLRPTPPQRMSATQWLVSAAYTAPAEIKLVTALLRIDDGHGGSLVMSPLQFRINVAYVDPYRDPYVPPVLPPPALKVEVRRPALGVALTRGLTAIVRAPAASTARVTVSVDGATARRLGLARRKVPVVVATGAAKVPATVPTAVRAAFTAKARKALRRTRSVRVTVRVQAGSAAPTVSAVTLRR